MCTHPWANRALYRDRIWAKMPAKQPKTIDYLPRTAQKTNKHSGIYHMKISYIHVARCGWNGINCPFWLIFGCFWPNLAILVALHGLIWLYPRILHIPIIHTSVPDTFRGKKEPKNYFFLGLNLVLAQNWLKNGQKWLKTATNQKSNLTSKTGLECHFQKWSNFLFWSLFCSWKQNFQGQK